MGLAENPSKVHVKDRSQTLHGLQRRIAAVALNAADVGPIKPGRERSLLLAHPR